MTRNGYKGSTKLGQNFKFAPAKLGPNKLLATLLRGRDLVHFENFTPNHSIHFRSVGVLVVFGLFGAIYHIPIDIEVEMGD